MAIEEKLRRPGVYPIGVPQRKTIVDRDRPADALRLEVLRYIPALLLCRRFGGVNTDNFEPSCAISRVKVPQQRRDVTTIEAVDREDVQDDDLPRGLWVAVEPIRCGENGGKRGRRACTSGAREKDGA